MSAKKNLRELPDEEARLGVLRGLAKDSPAKKVGPGKKRPKKKLILPSGY